MLLLFLHGKVWSTDDAVDAILYIYIYIVEWLKEG